MRYTEIICEKAGTDITSPAFRRWFGDSRVIDRTGAPLVVYHGTMFTFSAFYHGSHFGDVEAANARLANIAKGERSPYRQHQGTILPVYLSIQNPLRIIDDTGLTDGYDLAKAAWKAGGITQEEYRMVTDTGSPGVARLRLFKLLNREYDGLVYQNAVEGNADSWIPLQPNQVKSIFNKGTWSSSNEISEDGSMASR